MKRPWFQSLSFAALAWTLTACSAGGCSGCGFSPIAEGFDDTQAVPNAAVVRVTRPGLDFIGEQAASVVSKMLGSGGQGGVLTLPIPQGTVKLDAIGGAPLTYCVGGPDAAATPPRCQLQLDLAKAKIRVDGVGPSSVRIAGTIPVRLDGLRLRIDVPDEPPVQVTVALGEGECAYVPGGAHAKISKFKDLPLEIVIPLVADPHNGGRTRLDLNKMTARAKLAPVDQARTSKLIHACSETCYDATAKQPTAACEEGEAGAEGNLASLLSENLGLLFKPLLTGKLCKQDVCPPGSRTEAGGGTCYWDAPATQAAPNAPAPPKECVAVELGAEGNLDLGSKIAKFAPGNQSAFDILLAANGDLGIAPGQPLVPAPVEGAPFDVNAKAPNGLTLSAVGGFALPKLAPDGRVPLTCIPDDVKNPVPAGLPIPDEMVVDAPKDWKGEKPSLGVAVSERFLSYAITNLYKGCVLSLGVTTDSMKAIHSGVLSLLFPSLEKLTQDWKSSSIAIVTRPNKPPVITFGNGTDVATDPHVRLKMDRFSLDFFVWSSDRFIRAFSWTADVDIPLNVQTGVSKENPTGGILPVLGPVKVLKPTVTGSELLFEEPQKIADGLASVLPGLVSQMAGSIPPVDVSSLMKPLGFGVDIPTGGIRRLNKSGEGFLGVFGRLAVPPPDKDKIDTGATVTSAPVVPEGSTSLASLDLSKATTFRTHLSANKGGAESAASDVEYAYWIDEGTRSAWSPDADVTVRGPEMLLQGKHTLHVVARTRGRTMTEDTSPADVPFIIDSVPPQVRIKELSDGIAVDAWDYVSQDEALQGRFRVTNKGSTPGDWSEWQPLAQVAKLRTTSQLGHVEVEIKDEAGNIGNAGEDIQRGTDAPASCGCSTPGRSGANTTAAGLGALALLVLGASRKVARRTRREPRTSC